MKQISLSNGFEMSAKRTRKRAFLEEMERVVPWTDLVALIVPHMPPGKTGRPPYPAELLLRIHFLQQWFGLSDPAMEEALYDIPLYRQFARLDLGNSRLPDESTLLRFRHLLEAHNLAAKMLLVINTTLAAQGLMLKTGSVVDATLIDAPSSTKNKDGKRGPEMHQVKKGNQWHFGMKAHIAVDVDSGLVHTVIGTAANVHDVTQAAELLHGEETTVWADAGYRGIEKRPETQERPVTWKVAMMPGKRKQLDTRNPIGALINTVERTKASIRAKVEHPFRVIKCQFGFTKVRYRGLMKNTAQLNTLFALSNLWMARKHILLWGAQG